MIEEKGIVKEIVKDKAIIQSKRNSFCRNCPSEKFCKFFGDDNEDIEIYAFNRINAKVGDMVKIGIKENIFLKSTFIVYGIPVIGLIFFAIIGKFLFKKDIFSFITGVAGLILTFFIVKLFSKNKNVYPEIVEILHEDSCNK